MRKIGLHNESAYVDFAQLAEEWKTHRSEASRHCVLAEFEYKKRIDSSLSLAHTRHDWRQLHQPLTWIYTRKSESFPLSFLFSLYFNQIFFQNNISHVVSSSFFAFYCLLYSILRSIVICVVFDDIEQINLLYFLPRVCLCLCAMKTMMMMRSHNVCLGARSSQLASYLFRLHCTLQISQNTFSQFNCRSHMCERRTVRARDKTHKKMWLFNFPLAHILLSYNVWFCTDLLRTNTWMRCDTRNKTKNKKRNTNWRKNV